MGKCMYPSCQMGGGCDRECDDEIEVREVKKVYKKLVWFRIGEIIPIRSKLIKVEERKIGIDVPSLPDLKLNDTVEMALYELICDVKGNILYE